MVRAQTRAPQRTNHRQQLQQHALIYANEAGWPVFPIRPGTKRPAIPNHTAEDCDGTDSRCSVGHTGWEQRATTDSGRITRAWDRRPFGIGIACGPAGLLVVDLDVPKASGMSGMEALRNLERKHDQQLPETFTVETPSGGRHLYFTNKLQLGNTASLVGPRIDTRGAGGYVLAPPTQLPNGAYRLVNDHLPAELPEWFSSLLQPSRPPRKPQARRACVPVNAGSDPKVQRYLSSAIAGEVDRVTRATEGARNHSLFVASVAIGQLVGADLLPTNEAEQILEDASRSHVSAGAYGIGQARKTIASGLRRGIGEPRTLPASLTEGSRA